MTANEVKRSRQANRISQSRLAQLSGVSRFKISQMECGYQTLRANEIEMLILAFTKLRSSVER